MTALAARSASSLASPRPARPIPVTSSWATSWSAPVSVTRRTCSSRRTARWNRFRCRNGLRRWIVQTPEFMQPAPPGFISEIVKRRTGIILPPDDQTNESAFTPRRFDCTRYHQGRVVLCGDAAHGMSPIGGQGMNTGFADAEFLAEILPAIVQRARSLRAAARRLRAFPPQGRARTPSSALSGACGSAPGADACCRACAIS